MVLPRAAELEPAEAERPLRLPPSRVMTKRELWVIFFLRGNITFSAVLPRGECGGRPGQIFIFVFNRCTRRSRLNSPRAWRHQCMRGVICREEPKKYVSHARTACVRGVRDLKKKQKTDSPEKKKPTTTSPIYN